MRVLESVLYLFVLMSSALYSFGEALGQEVLTPKPEITRQYVEHRLRQSVEDGAMSLSQASVILEELDEWLANPKDINQVKEEELDRIGLLSPYQIYQFIRYRTDCGAIESIYDLKSLPGWSEEILSLILPLFIGRGGVQNVVLSEVRDYRSQRSLVSFGMKHIAERKPQVYLGNPLGVALKWRYLGERGMSVFLGAEQDSYEPWSYRGHRGFDSYAGHLSYSGSKWLRLAVVGDYRVHWGEGLVIAQGFRMRPPYQSLGSRRGISPVVGLSEGNKSRGVALVIGDKARITAIYSHRRLDARIDDEGLIRSLSEVGLHRTEQEWDRRGVATQRHWGVSLGYYGEYLTASAQALAVDFGRYRLASATGASDIEALKRIGRHTLVSVAYQWRSYRGALTLSGELARGHRGAFAWVQTLGYRSALLGEYSLALRRISSLYWSYLSQSITHAQRANNEEGVTFSGTSRELIRGVNMELGIDIYRPMVQTARKSVGWGSASRLSINSRVGERMLWSVSVGHSRQRGGDDRLRLSGRYHYEYSRWRGDVGASCSRGGQRWGKMLHGTLRYGASQSLSFWSSAAVFDIPEWSGRLYLPVPRVRDEHHFSMMYGKGWQCAVGGRWDIASHWGIDMKIVHLSRQGELSGRTALLANVRWQL